MRLETDLPHRLSKILGVDPDEVLRVLNCSHEIRPETPCWQWTGALTGRSMIPVFHYKGGMKPVRRVLHEYRTGVPNPPDLKIRQICANHLCIQPDHAESYWTRINGVFSYEHALVAPHPAEDSLEDIVSAIYSRPEPWDADALAAEFDYPVILVEEALALIREGKM